MQGSKRLTRIGIAQTVNEHYTFALRSASQDGQFLDFLVFTDEKSALPTAEQRR
jgi:hypothetical protein